jgi:hypothetical protein
MAALGNVDILVRSRLEVDPYFSILMSDPSVGWRRAWFLLRNDADAPLPVFTGGRPIPHPHWEYGVARADLHRLQPLLEVVRGLLDRGLTAAEILWTFLVVGLNRFVNEKLPCGCLRDQVAPFTPSPWVQAAQRSTSVYEGFLLLGSTRILVPTQSP